MSNDAALDALEFAAQSAQRDIDTATHEIDWCASTTERSIGELGRAKEKLAQIQAAIARLSGDPS